MNIAGYISILVILSLLIGYLFGSIMFADVASAILKKNVRELGSKNPGTTNSFRVFSKRVAITIGFFEVIKSVIPFAIIYCIYNFWLKDKLIELDQNINNKIYYLTYLAPLAAILGHMYPVFAKFKGGKAVATTAGFVFVVSPWWFLIIAVTWWTITLITKYVSLSSIVCFVIFIFLVYIPYLDYLWWFSFDKITYLTYQNDWHIITFFGIANFILSSSVIWKHRANIKRLINKQENKVTKKF
ncbi:glycerol-3-phosphate 1-O-acyltransferase PlsY [Mycoplasma bradburyae]|uniref:Glycerol-3-phosphate acyltransferase n=1 Tax=Mycoplasma bradburyae TaxID=2963128 RepID=A0AAW6HP05_9MOLU|nr:glycerol-3-phosphate 1-O-acyltransferase PlsY [Mycoplasma bradburyae]MDC4183424.1 glycerol-3-phosphate 1-O-acyltransferase PlsY [Mycoplasma bradburyae]